MAPWGGSCVVEAVAWWTYLPLPSSYGADSVADDDSTHALNPEGLQYYAVHV